MSDLSGGNGVLEKCVTWLTSLGLVSGATTAKGTRSTGETKPQASNAEPPKGLRVASVVSHPFSNHIVGRFDDRYHETPSASWVKSLTLHELSALNQVDQLTSQLLVRTRRVIRGGGQHRAH
jgi:hypothetical protein